MNTLRTGKIPYVLLALCLHTIRTRLVLLARQKISCDQSAGRYDRISQQLQTNGVYVREFAQYKSAIKVRPLLLK